jgi:hypothetical protein
MVQNIFLSCNICVVIILFAQNNAEARKNATDQKEKVKRHMLQRLGKEAKQPIKANSPQQSNS